MPDNMKDITGGHDKRAGRINPSKVSRHGQLNPIKNPSTKPGSQPKPNR